MLKIFAIFEKEAKVIKSLIISYLKESEIIKGKEMNKEICFSNDPKANELIVLSYLNACLQIEADFENNLYFEQMTVNFYKELSKKAIESILINGNNSEFGTTIFQYRQKINGSVFAIKFVYEEEVALFVLRQKLEKEGINPVFSDYSSIRSLFFINHVLLNDVNYVCDKIIDFLNEEEPQFKEGKFLIFQYNGFDFFLPPNLVEENEGSKEEEILIQGKHFARFFDFDCNVL